MSIVFVLAMFMTLMDATIVNVAVPTLGRQFHVGPQAIDVVVTSYLVSLAVFILASGWLGDRLGTKKVLLTAIAIFTVASALCGQAHSLDELLIFRVLQGAGGGILQPVGMAMLIRTFPPSERIRMSQILQVPTSMAPALGPVVGGLLIDSLSWRWIFYVNVPIGVIAFVFGVLFVEERREANPGRFDLAGFLLSGGGFALLLYSISEGASKGWASVGIVSTGSVGVALLVAMVIVELKSAEPMLDLRLFGDRLFRTTSIVLFLSTVTLLGTLYIVALFFQDGLHASALRSGLSTFPESIGVMISVQIAARLYPKLGPRRLIAAGLAGAAVVSGLMTLAGAGTTFWYMRVLMFLLGIAMGYIFAPAQTAAFATISPTSMGRASSLFNALRQLGSAVGVAALTTVLVAVTRTSGPVGDVARPNLSGYHVAFASAAALALFAAVAALFIKDEDAAATMAVERASGE